MAAVVARGHAEARSEAPREGLGIAKPHVPGEVRDRRLAREQKQGGPLEPQALHERHGGFPHGLPKETVKVEARVMRLACEGLQRPGTLQGFLDAVHGAYDGFRQPLSSGHGGNLAGTLRTDMTNLAQLSAT